ncbi:MAG TPA: TolC family outer membrane protein [Rhodospirillales bacterium]|jgi:outer membrane protein|nr:TolC family outer membrane protein [Rhodospirillales bacterium]
MNNRLPGVLGHLGFILCLVLFMSGEATAQTLEDALTSAYINNPTLLGQRAKVRATDEQVPQALSNWRPSIEITGSAGVVDNKSTLRSDRTQQREPKSFDLTVSQDLYRGGRTFAALREADNTIRAERSRLLETEQDVLLSASQAFFDVFRDEAVLKLTINNEQVLTRHLEATRDRFEVGEITRTDVHQAEARLAGTVADRIAAEGALEASRAAYRNIVGIPAPKVLVAATLPSDLPKSSDEVIKAAAVNNPSVISAEFDRKALGDNVEEVRGELLPRLSVSTGVSRKIQSGGEEGRIDSADLTLNLTVPLYQQGEVFSRLREAKQDVAEQLQVIDQARRDAVEEATKAWESLLTARARVASFKTQIGANVVALEGVRREAQVGSRTVLDVLDAEQESLDSRVSHVSAQRDELLAVFELKAAMGQLTSSDLKLPVAAYDPMDNYQKVRDKWFGADIPAGKN